MSSIVAVPFAGATATDNVTVCPASGSLTATLPVAGMVAAVVAVASPTAGGWFGAAPTSMVTVACPQTVGEIVLQTS